MRTFYLIILIISGFNTYAQIKPSWMWDKHLGNNYKVDTNYIEKNSFKYIPVKKDSIFPTEYIIISFDSSFTKKRKFLKNANKISEISGLLSMSQGAFIKGIGNGESVQNIFFEFSYYFNEGLDGEFGYLRRCYLPYSNKKGYTYNIYYICPINKKKRRFKPIYSLDHQIKYFEKKRNRFINLLDYESNY